MSKFKVGDLVNTDNYEMDGCCHDCEGTGHYLDYPEFIISEINETEKLAFHKDSESGYNLEHLKLLCPDFVNAQLYKELNET